MKRKEKKDNDPAPLVVLPVAPQMPLLPRKLNGSLHEIQDQHGRGFKFLQISKLILRTLIQQAK